MRTAAAPSDFMCKLKSRQEVAEDTMAFHFEKPTGWTFKPGQYVDMTLLDPRETDSQGNIRSFSIASAPQESTLMVATRIRDTAFKRGLRTMPLGTQVRVEGPLGSFTLHSNASRPAVFLAGGIGITPFRSIIVNAASTRLENRIVLFYSNRRPEDCAFLQELQEIGDDNKNYQIIGVMTGMEKSKRQWNGEIGFIDKVMLGRFVPDVAAPIYYIAGPPAMVAAMKKTLANALVNEDDVRSEDFAGY
ncbi:MAG: FAD-dependent oxidoreductase [Candidatus Acidiferrales bacterium]